MSWMLGCLEMPLLLRQDGRVEEQTERLARLSKVRGHRNVNNSVPN